MNEEKHTNKENCGACRGSGRHLFNDKPSDHPCYPCFGTGRDLRRWGTQIERHRGMLALLVHLNVPTGAVGRACLPHGELEEWADAAREHLGDEFAAKLRWDGAPPERDPAALARWLRERADELEAGRPT